jgi:hypothetical protein
MTPEFLRHCAKVSESAKRKRISMLLRMITQKLKRSKKTEKTTQKLPNTKNPSLN